MQAKHVPAEKFFAHTRVVCLPGFTATVKDILEALVEVAGGEALKLVRFEKRDWYTDGDCDVVENGVFFEWWLSLRGEQTAMKAAYLSLLVFLSTTLTV